MLSTLRVFSLLIFISAFGSLNGQNSTAYIDVERRCDSLFQDLESKGVSTIFLYRKVPYYYDYYQSEDLQNIGETALIFWKQSDSIYFKKVTAYYESSRESGVFQNILDFYIYNKEEIDRTELSKGDNKDSGIMVRDTTDDFYSLGYLYEDKYRELSWQGKDLEKDDFPTQQHLQFYSSRLYTMILLIEREILFMDLNYGWDPLDKKYGPENDDWGGLQEAFQSIDDSFEKAKQDLFSDDEDQDERDKD